MNKTETMNINFFLKTFQLQMKIIHNAPDFMKTNIVTGYMSFILKVYI